MLDENLFKSSGVENQLLNDAELFELPMGSGLGAEDGESHGAWPSSSSEHQLYSTQGQAGSAGQRTRRRLRPAAAPPSSSLTSGARAGACPGKKGGRLRKGRMSWEAGENGREGRRGEGRAGGVAERARCHVTCVGTCRPSCVVEAEDWLGFWETPCPGPQVTSDSVSLPSPAPLRAPAPPFRLGLPGLPPALASPPLWPDPAQPHGHPQAARQSPRPARASGEGTVQVRGRSDSPAGGKPGPGASRLPSWRAPSSGARWHRSGSRGREEGGGMASVRPACLGPEGSPSTTWSSGPATRPASGCPG